MSTRKENMSKQCKNCYKIKPLSRFTKNKKNKDGLESYCADCKSQIQRERRKANPETFLKAERKYEEKRKLKRIRGEMPHRVEAMRIRVTNNHLIKQIIENNGNDKIFLKHVNCSVEKLKSRFEKEFEKNPGMGWHNHGAWHMDHKKPLKEFKLDTEADRKLANHYTNLRPQWATYNMQKGSKYIQDDV